MRIKVILIALALIQFSTTVAQIEGNYQTTGYVFVQNDSRPINVEKTIVRISTNRYRVNFADYPTDYFQFDIDAGNNVTNWMAVGNLPAAPATGFMSADNPGSYAHYPGATVGFIHSTYNNTYDPVTQTLYLHYGYGTGAINQSGYSWQVYEKYQIVLPPSITSFSPTSGTFGTVVTITGQNLSSVNSVRFSYYYGSTDSFYVVNDNTIKAIIGSSASGKLYLSNNIGTDSSDNSFSYTPPLVSNTEWLYLGQPGFSGTSAPQVNMALNNSNVPYVLYSDSATEKAIVKRYVNNIWENVGTSASDDTALRSEIAISSDGTPYIAYVNKSVGGGIVVRKFNGSAWADVGSTGLQGYNNYNNIALELDKNGNPWLAVDNNNNMYVYRFTGTIWENLGFIATVNQYSLAIDTVYNIAYVQYTDNAYYPSVKRYNGTVWEQAGNQYFSDGTYGGYHPNIGVNQYGYPYVAVQEDNGFERLSVYNFNGLWWAPIGAQKFSKSHSHWTSLAFTNKGLPMVAFTSSSFNNNGSVMVLNTANRWEFVGSRGFAPWFAVQRHGLAIDTNDVPYVAFIDENNSNRVSVMKYNAPVNTNSLKICPSGSLIINSDVFGSNMQWQVNTGSGFVNITDGANYTGTNGVTLQLISVPSTWYGYQYRCIADGKYSSTNTIYVAEEWTGRISTAWEDPGNWECGMLPDENTDVIFDSGDNVILNSNTTIRSIKVAPSSSFLIEPGSVLNVIH